MSDKNIECIKQMCIISKVKELKTIVSFIELPDLSTVPILSPEQKTYYLNMIVSTLDTKIDLLLKQLKEEYEKTNNGE